MICSRVIPTSTRSNVSRLRRRPPGDPPGGTIVRDSTRVVPMPRDRDDYDEPRRPQKDRTLLVALLAAGGGLALACAGVGAVAAVGALRWAKPADRNPDTATGPEATAA